MVAPEKISEISRRLAALEQEEDARILLAVESGSRAWGFPSLDSDYDVRFIYVRKAEWYLSVNLEARRDVIERPLVDDFDFSGWDLRKALKLFAKSNPPLLEWLDSSIVYLDQFGFAAQLRALRSAFFSPPACAYHYLHMAQGNFRASLQSATVREKKYFYVLRPILAVRWIEQNRGVVPMRFTELLHTIPDEIELRREIDALLERKMGGIEKNEVPPIVPIYRFIESELARMETMKVDPTYAQLPQEKLDHLFRAMIGEVWGMTFGV